MGKNDEIVYAFCTVKLNYCSASLYLTACLNDFLVVVYKQAVYKQAKKINSAVFVKKPSWVSKAIYKHAILCIMHHLYCVFAK